MTNDFSNSKNNINSNNCTFGNIPYSKEQQEAISQRLDMRLGPEYISYRQGPGGSN